jgi:hypothetical protein
MSPARMMRARRRRLTVATVLSLAARAVHADAALEPLPFPTFADGLRAPAALFEPGAQGEVYVEQEHLEEVATLTADNWCKIREPDLPCAILHMQARVIKGKPRKSSAYSELDIDVSIKTPQGPVEKRITHEIVLVQSCPVDAVLINDQGVFYENRSDQTGYFPMACISPETLPKVDSLGVPTESGANQCPVGNAATVGKSHQPAHHEQDRSSRRL